MLYSLTLILELCGYDKEHYQAVIREKSYKYRALSLLPDDPALYEEDLLYISTWKHFSAQLSKSGTAHASAPGTANAPASGSVHASAPGIHPGFYNLHGLILIDAGEIEFSEIDGSEIVSPGFGSPESGTHNIPTANYVIFPAARGLEDLGTCFQHFLHAFCLLNERTAHFYELLSQQAPLQKSIEAIYDYLEIPGYILDSSFRLMAIERRSIMRDISPTWRQTEEYGFVPYDHIVRYIESSEMSPIDKSSGLQMVHVSLFNMPFLQYNFQQKDRISGHMYLIPLTKHLTPGQLEQIEIYARIIAQHFQLMPFSSSNIRYYGWFMQNLLQGKTKDPALVTRQLKALAYHADSRFVIISLRPILQNQQIIEQLITILENEFHTKPVFMDDKITALTPVNEGTSISYILHQLEESTRKNASQIVISDSFHGYARIPLAYRQTAEVFKTLPENRDEVIVITYQTWLAERLKGNPYYLMKAAKSVNNPSGSSVHNPSRSNADDLPANLFIPLELYTLKEHDILHRTELILTLKTYLEIERNSVLTAELMHIHRNTLNYRIKTILSLCSFDLNDIETRLRLILVLSILGLTGEL